MSMALPHRWSLALVSGRTRRIRWLTETGHFSSDPAKALRLINPELAAQRVQAFMALRGWDVTVMERFQLVPAPEKTEIRISYARTAPLQRAACADGSAHGDTTRRSSSRSDISTDQAAAA
jgi:hypothetical protein